MDEGNAGCCETPKLYLRALVQGIMRESQDRNLLKKDESLREVRSETLNPKSGWHLGFVPMLELATSPPDPNKRDQT